MNMNEEPKEPTQSEPDPTADVERISRPTEGYREETLIEKSGDLTIPRMYGIIRLPNLNIEAWIPSYLLIKEFAQDVQRAGWEQDIFLIKKFVSIPATQEDVAKEISKEDVVNLLSLAEWDLLRKTIAYVKQEYELSKEKKTISSSSL